jgi:hypothetical protein
MRDEADRLVKEALQRHVVVKEGNTRIAAKCRKCGAPNRISAARGEARVAFIACCLLPKGLEKAMAYIPVGPLMPVYTCLSNLNALCSRGC